MDDHSQTAQVSCQVQKMMCHAVAVLLLKACCAFCACLCLAHVTQKDMRKRTEISGVCMCTSVQNVVQQDSSTNGIIGTFGSSFHAMPLLLVCASESEHLVQQVADIQSMLACRAGTGLSCLSTLLLFKGEHIFHNEVHNKEFKKHRSQGRCMQLQLTVLFYMNDLLVGLSWATHRPPLMT